jgi:hypothetical protein
MLPPPDSNQPDAPLFVPERGRTHPCRSGSLSRVAKRLGDKRILFVPRLKIAWQNAVSEANITRPTRDYT